ncbi:MAG: ASPIC/UnbV domain protein [Bacteroidetes bacterium]|nr:ASPIC/UnbV domain protein [Bacteroidota bacterium]
MIKNSFANSATALRTFRLKWILSICLICVSYSVTAQKPVIRFTDVTKRTGIDFMYTFGDLSYRNIIESSGSGITIFDYNNDKLMDLFMMNGTYLEGISDPGGKKFINTPDRLYRNNGNGTFGALESPSGTTTSTEGSTPWLAISLRSIRLTLHPRLPI